MFNNEETQSVDQFVPQGDLSNVDIIESSTVEVTSVVTVADTKTKRVNLATIVTQLSNLSDAQIEDTRPSVIKELGVQTNRIVEKYKSILLG